MGFFVTDTRGSAERYWQTLQGSVCKPQPVVTCVPLPCTATSSEDCRRESNGSPCQRDTQCGSGHCVGLFCQECGSSDHCAPGQFCDVTTLFKCRDLKPDGSICVADAQCASGHCYLGGCRTCVSDNHCAPDQFCELFDVTKLYTCRGDMGRGGACDRNSQCTSGKCDGIPLFKKCT
ncbi:hypothetical protein HXX76_015508 [Chlamydomonas incerta]|uniref:Uncharacterized protein n=1 Tax=Chlamydomonas incerta TaxID=51695 RepID=A0A835SGT4_CHLIN|nr:hypothetical protein HXX76_015508 [Chlamydomonas incerta]|eukprot:KAG2423123.1 hypothetical protein HXX76_015508 [Chlamydomonas incerta]